MDLRERLLPREAFGAGGVAELVAKEVHHVGAVGLVEDGERRRQTERLAMDAEEPVRDRVEGTAPDAARLAMAGALGAVEHLAGGPAAEGEQQDPFRPGA